MFAVALVNSDFKTAEPDYRNMEDTLISAGLDILSDVTFLILSFLIITYLFMFLCKLLILNFSVRFS